MLLHLIKEGNTDIFDINISVITDKYLEYINKEKEININVSSEYLVMAAELMYLKSRSLLPNENKKEEEADEEVTRENLINRLVEYQRYKELTGTFKELERERKNIYIKSPEKVSEYVEMHYDKESSVDELLNAFKMFLNRKELDKPLETTIAKKEYSVKDRKKKIRNILSSKKEVSLEELIDDYSRPYLVVTFLSILEMVKEKDVNIKQDRNFDKILIELRDV